MFFVHGAVTHPVTGTNCLGSSHILHDGKGVVTEYWTPQVEQIWRSRDESDIVQCFIQEKLMLISRCVTYLQISSIPLPHFRHLWSVILVVYSVSK